MPLVLHKGLETQREEHTRTKREQYVHVGSSDMSIKSSCVYRTTQGCKRAINWVSEYQGVYSLIQEGVIEYSQVFDV